MTPRRRQGSPDSPVARGRQGDAPARPRAVQRQVEALRFAARSRHADALARADKGLRQLVKSGGEVNFRAVARAGPVSLNFLYEQPDLRKRIEHLRAQQQAASAANRRRLEQGEPSSSNAIVSVLAGQMKKERARHLEQVRELEERLAAAHAEILRLTRALASGQGSAAARPRA